MRWSTRDKWTQTGWGMIDWAAALPLVLALVFTLACGGDPVAPEPTGYELTIEADTTGNRVMLVVTGVNYSDSDAEMVGVAEWVRCLDGVLLLEHVGPIVLEPNEAEVFVGVVTTKPRDFQLTLAFEIHPEPHTPAEEDLADLTVRRKATVLTCPRKSKK